LTQSSPGHLEVANFYCRFIVGFSNIVIPLIRLTHKDTPFTWGPNHTKAFDMLKAAFTQAPILVHFNPDNPDCVETHPSDYVITTIISQISPDDGNIHPIMFYSCSMQPVELNYDIYDRELLAIFEAFRQWRNYLKGSATCRGSCSPIIRTSILCSPPSSSHVAKSVGRSNLSGFQIPDPLPCRNSWVPNQMC